MISQLPILTCPDWLKNLEAQSIAEDEFPLNDILSQSLYYPASHFDGDPVRHLAGNIHSFIYVDYGYTAQDLDQSLRHFGFRGYHIIGRRRVLERELNPKGTKASGLNLEIDAHPERLKWYIKKPFCEWIVFQRNRDMDQTHGPERFSLLYISGDGAATYQVLFSENCVSPTAISIIQPGEGFGGNWTSFKDPSKILARSVRNNSAGMPKFLLDGQYSKSTRCDPACWPDFDQFICLLHKSNGGNISLFSSLAASTEFLPDQTPPRG